MNINNTYGSVGEVLDEIDGHDAVTIENIGQIEPAGDTYVRVGLSVVINTADTDTPAEDDA